MTKVTLEQKKHAVDLAISGEDPRPYLRECGSRNADLMWGKIREKLKEADPETFAQLPDKIPRSDKGKTRNEPEQVEVPEVKVDGPIRISATEPEKVEVKPARTLITKPMVYDGLEVCEVKGNFARYRRVDAHGNTYIDVEMKDGDEMLSFTVEQWRSFRKEHDRAALILGVEL